MRKKEKIRKLLASEAKAWANLQASMEANDVGTVEIKNYEKFLLLLSFHFIPLAEHVELMSRTVDELLATKKGK